MKHLPLTQERINQNHRDRLRAVERRLSRPDRPQTLEVAPFSVIGDMEVTTSGKWEVHTGGQIVVVKFHATAAGSGSTVYRVLLNGSLIGSSVTVLAATTEQSSYLGDYRASKGDTLQWDITTAGFHEHATLQIHMKG